MEMHPLEKWALRSRLRALLQRRLEAPRLFAGLDVPDGASCVEVGCGRGTGTLLILRHLRAGRVVGVDVDATMLAAARRLLERPPRWARVAGVRTDAVELLQAQTGALPLPDGHFDVAVFFFLLDHVPQRRAVLAEVHRVLKPGGWLAFEEAFVPDHPLLLNRLFGHVPFTAGQLRAELEEAGFAIRKFRTYRLLPLCFGQARRLPAAPNAAGPVE